MSAAVKTTRPPPLFGSSVTDVPITPEKPEMKESGEVSLAGFTLFAVVGGTLVEFKVSPSSDESVLSKEFHPTATTALGSTVSEAAKFAVIEIFESIESVKGFSELSLPVQPVNSYPVSGVAVFVTEPPVVVND